MNHMTRVSVMYVHACVLNERYVMGFAVDAYACTEVGEHEYIYITEITFKKKNIYIPF